MYMYEKCEKAKSEPSEFWKTVKPYFSEKSKCNSTFQLNENDRLVNNQQRGRRIIQNFPAILVRTLLM